MLRITTVVVSVLCLSIISLTTLVSLADTTTPYYVLEATNPPDQSKWSVLAKSPITVDSTKALKAIADRMAAIEANPKAAEEQERKVRETAAKDSGAPAAALSLEKFQFRKPPGPPIAEIASGWMYVIGSKPTVGTEWVYGSASGTCLLVTIQGSGDTAKHRIYFHRAQPKHELETVRIYDASFNVKMDLHLYQFVEVTKNGANYNFAGPLSEPVDFNTIDDPMAKQAEDIRLKYQWAEY
jgi:hypothetical protein